MVIVNKFDTLNRVVGLIQFSEDINQIVGYALVANKFTLVFASLRVEVFHLQIA